MEFLVFFNKQNKKQKRENYLHGKAPNKQKKNKEIFLDFLFSATTKHAYKVNYFNYFFVFLKFFKHTRRKQENKTKHGCYNEKMCIPTNRMICEHECNVGEKHVLPQA